jgi:hypothetical protein
VHNINKDWTVVFRFLAVRAIVYVLVQMDIGGYGVAIVLKR